MHFCNQLEVLVDRPVGASFCASHVDLVEGKEQRLHLAAGMVLLELLSKDRRVHASVEFLLFSSNLRDQLLATR